MICLLLLLLCARAVWGDYQIQSIVGEVESGNYTYYKLQWEGPITIVLDTLSGDADLYVSETHLKPSFEPDQFDFSSTTCGLDSVDIPRAIPRPLGVSVYGHPRHDFTRFELRLIYRHPDYLDQFTLREDNGTDSELLDSLQQRAGHSQVHEESHVMDLVWTFVEVFLEVLLL